jgi:hypothetical protein
MVKARPLSEWHEGIGDALWWRFPITESPYVGTPLDTGEPVTVEVRRYGNVGEGEIGIKARAMTVMVGGWPGYHTHWTPMPELPENPQP